ncbi:MAG: DnaT-like ssDNA-binding protein [Pseudomonadota bacterium]
MLTKEDGSIVTDANTFALEADVTAYIALYGWSFTGSTQAREQAILRAMLFIESLELKLQGERVSTAQELSWPREYVYNLKKTAYLSDATVPDGVVNAVCEAAVIELATPGTLTQTIGVNDIGVKRAKRKIGPLETETEFQHRDPLARSHYTRIIGFLKPYMKSTLSSGLLMRA